MANDKDIWTALNRDPEKGFRLLMARYQEPVYWHIRRLLVSHDDAQDATQETFIRVFRSLEQYRGESSLITWIYRIATNEALRLLERRKETQASLDTDASPEALRLMADEYVDYADAEAVRLQQAIQALPPKQQLAFNLRYYDELGYDDITQITGQSVGSAKTNYHIAKEKIIKYMNLND